MQLYSNGQRTDDISEYGRSCFLYSLLKPQEWYNQRGLEGFWQDLGGNAVAIPAGEYRDVLMAPTLIGLFQSGKMLPPQLNLVLEIEFAEAGGRPTPCWRHLRFQHRERQGAGLPGDAGQRPGGSPSTRCCSRAAPWSSPTQPCTPRSPTPLWRHQPQRDGRAYTKLMGAFVTFRQTTDSLGESRNLEYPGPGAHPFNLEGQMQLGALQYPRNAITSSAEFHHFLEIMGGTYDSKIKNMRIVDQFYSNNEFIAAFSQAPAQRHQHPFGRPGQVHLQEHAGGPRPAHVHPPGKLSDRDPVGRRCLCPGLRKP